MTINELQDNVIEEFSVFDDWMDKYALLIDLGNSLPPLDEKYKTESNLIEGCQSRVCSKRIMWMEKLFSKEKATRDRKRYRIPFDQYPIRPYPAGDTGCRSLLYRQGRIKRAFIPYPFQRVGSDGEANASIRDGLPGKGTTIKTGIFTRI